MIAGTDANAPLIGTFSGDQTDVSTFITDR